MADGEEKNLRSILADAVTASEAPETPAAPAPAAAEPAETPAEASEASSETRERDENGRFKPAKSEKAPVEVKEAPEKAGSEAKDDEKPDSEGKSADSDSVAPPHWSQADKEWLGQLPKEHQAAVVERFKRIEAGFTPKLQQLAQIEKDYGQVIQFFQPALEGLRQRGQTPADIIGIYAGLEQGLTAARNAAERGMNDPNGANIVARIIQGYRIDPGQVAQALQALQSGQPVPAQNGNGATAPAITPEYQQVIAPLAQQVNQITQFLTEQQRIDQDRRVTQAQSQIDSFASEKNPDGSLKHPFYSELEDDITQRARFLQSQGKSIDLSALYDEAVYANRSTRDRVLSSQRQADEKRAADERKAKAAAAQKAASSVSGSPSPGQASQRLQTPRSIRDSLMTAMEETDAR